MTINDADHMDDPIFMKDEPNSRFLLEMTEIHQISIYDCCPKIGNCFSNEHKLFNYIIFSHLDILY